MEEINNIIGAYIKVYFIDIAVNIFQTCWNEFFFVLRLCLTISNLSEDRHIQYKVCYQVFSWLLLFNLVWMKPAAFSYSTSNLQCLLMTSLFFGSGFIPEITELWDFIRYKSSYKTWFVIRTLKSLTADKYYCLSHELIFRPF